MGDATAKREYTGQGMGKEGFTNLIDDETASTASTRLTGVSVGSSIALSSCAFSSAGSDVGD